MGNHILYIFWLPFIIGAFGKNARIIGGELTSYSDFPYAVTFRLVESGSLVCAGTIITETHILTAAHCIFGRQQHISLVEVHTGLTSSPQHSIPPYSLKKISIHPDFVGEPIGKNGCHNDIAIATTQEIMEFNELQNKIALPTAPLRVGDDVIIVGWGLTSYPSDRYPNELYYTKVKIVGRPRCVKSFTFPILTDQICTHANDRGSCIGDSGGPVVKDDKIVGIISYSVPCATEAPDLHTDVFRHLHYIYSKIYHD